MRRRNIAATVAVLTACFGGALFGQPPAGQAGRGGPRGPEPLPFEDHAGFVSIFDGSTLKGWDGDTKFWRVESGAIVGQTTADNALKENSFIIWRGGEPAQSQRTSASNSSSVHKSCCRGSTMRACFGSRTNTVSSCSSGLSSAPMKGGDSLHQRVRINLVPSAVWGTEELRE
jgi:hypothetical protein